MQLRSTVDHNKSMKEEVTTLKKDFKQKEDKYIEEFLDIKKLKEKVEDRLFKQDQSVQTVHMLCKPKPFYDEKKKVAIAAKNPFCAQRAKQVQSALYNGTEIVMTNHKPAVVHDSEETLEIAELTRKRISVNATPTVKIVLNKGKQIWKPKGKLSDNSLNKTKRVWKAMGKLFADIGYQWRPTRKKFSLGKLNYGYQWRPTGKKFALGELCPLIKLFVKCSIISANQQDPNKN
ncbi:hypothetical protein Tco_0345575 [Tanacetum coccineum]